MNTKQAFMILSAAARKALLTAEGHEMVNEAIRVLSEAFAPSKESENAPGN